MSRLVALVIFLSVSIWLSLGVVSITNVRTVSRVAALPVWWLVPVLAAALFALISKWWPQLRARSLLPLVLLWLPYLPVRIPPAFLIWQGPIALALWIVVGLRLLYDTDVAQTWRRIPWLTDPSRAPWVAAMVGTACAIGAFVNVRPALPAGDEPHYLVITQSLLADGDLQVENNHRRGDYLDYYKWEFGPHYIRRGVNGGIYSSHLPGLSAIVLPGFALGGYLGAVAVVLAIAAAGSALTWASAWMLTSDAGAAWVAWAATCLTTPLLLLDFTIFPDGIAGALTIGIAAVLLRFETKRPVALVHIGGAAICIALLPWLNARLLFIALPGLLVLLTHLNAEPKRWMKLATATSIPAVSLIGWLGYFWIIYGTPSPNAPWGNEANLTTAYLIKGSVGLLMDQQFGLFTNAAVYAFAPVGLVLLARRHARFALEWLLIVSPTIALLAMYSGWWGGFGPSARYVAAVAPLAALPIAWLWRERRDDGWRALITLALVVSVLAVLARIVVGDGSVLYNDDDGFDKLLAWANQSVDLPLAAPSQRRGEISTTLIDAAVWISVLGLSAALVTFRKHLNSRVDRWTAAILGSALAAMAASSIVWARHDSTGATSNRSKVAAIANWTPNWQSSTFSLDPLARIDHRQFLARLQFSTTDRTPDRDASVLLAVSSVPAGDYEVATTATLRHGELVARVGARDLVVDWLEIPHTAPGFTGALLRLPVPVSRLTLHGESLSDRSGTPIALHIRRSRPAATAGVALRAVRYGHVRAFAMDDRVFVEPGGFWTHGQQQTTLVLDVSEVPAGKELIMRLRSGPVSSPLELQFDSIRQQLSLAPQEERDLIVPRFQGDGTIVLSITTPSRFRPVDHVAGNGDGRSLGVWIEFR